MNNAKKCPQCGNIVSLEARVCAGCSHSFRTVFDPTNPQPSTRQAPTPLDISVAAPPARTSLVQLPGLLRQHRILGRSHQVSQMASRWSWIIVVGVVAFLGWLAYGFFQHAGAHLPPLGR